MASEREKIGLLLGLLLGLGLTVVAGWETYRAIDGNSAAWWQASGTVMGLAIIWYEISEVKRNSERQERATRSELYRGASDGMAHINDTFAKHPWLRSYFYEHRDPGQLPSKSELAWRDHSGLRLPVSTLAILIEGLCETIADFADDLLEQYRTIPDEMDWATWWRFLRFLYQHSPAFRTWADDNLEFYPDYLHAYFGHIIVRDADSRRLLGRWSAYEIPNEPDSTSSPDLPTWRDAALVRLAELGEAATEDPSDRRYPWYDRWHFQYEDSDSDGDGSEEVKDSPSIVASVIPRTAREVDIFICRPSEYSCPLRCPDERGRDAICDREQHRVTIRAWLANLLDQSGAEKANLIECFEGSEPRISEDRQFKLWRLKLHQVNSRFHVQTHRPTRPWPRRVGLRSNLRRRSALSPHTHR